MRRWFSSADRIKAKAPKKSSKNVTTMLLDCKYEQLIILVQLELKVLRVNNLHTCLCWK